MKKVTFTEDQLDAIDAGKRHLDACVVAGPGSGKTTVLVEYFRRLVEAGVDPLRILAITFTEKAAGNMRTKLAEAFREEPAIRAKLERAWVSTVHGFCARLLREHAVFAGVDPEFAVADERESGRLQQDAMAAAMDGLLAEHPAAMRALIRGLSSYEFEGAVLSAYDAMRGAGVRVEELAQFDAPAGTTVAEVAESLRALRREGTGAWSYAQREQLEAGLEGAGRVVSAEGPLEALQAIESFSCNLNKCKRGNTAYDLLKRMKEQIEGARYALITEFYTAERETLLEILRRFDRIYRERKQQGGLLDFSDLEEFAVRLLEEHSDTRLRVREQFEHVLMDEFQDTNGQQARLMQLVRTPDRFYAVGDINQSIFGFRHAEPEGFENYQREVASTGRHLAELTDNFRSRGAVLAAVETLTDGAAGIVPRPLVARREFAEPRDVCVEALSATELAVEARWVAKRIAELETEGFGFADVAVLVRNTEVIGEFTAAFDEAGIPYVVNRGRGFYAAREVADLTHLLRCIANPRDEISMAAVLRSPLVGVSDEALFALKLSADNLGGGLMRLGDGTWEADAEDLRRLVHFRDRLRRWRLRRESVSFDRLLQEAMDDCGYQPETGARGAANIDKFLAQAREASRRMSLDAFVEELALLRKANPREPDASLDEQAPAVKVMTVHSAKGLEFPVVFVAAIHIGVDSNPPVVAFSRTYGLGARWRNPAKREDKDDLFQHALREEWKVREQREADRLLYVAVTRAEELLVLSFSGNRRWAKEVAGRLGLATDGAHDRVETRNAPDGEEWKLRVVGADRALEPAARRNGQPAVAAQWQPEPVALPEVREQQDANATVTALYKFAACPREYLLGQYLGFEGRPRKLEEEDGELAAGEFGTQVHALLAGTTVVNADAEAVRLAEVFRQSALGKRAQRAGRLEREFDFLMAVEGLVVLGQVDLWFEESGELVIVDYKTDAVNAAEAHKRARDYELQLRLYAMAVERVAGRPVDRAWLHFLRPNTVVEVDLTPSLLESPEQLARDFQEAQEKGEFPLREGERCVRCPFYRDLCPAGG